MTTCFKVTEVTSYGTYRNIRKETVNGYTEFVCRMREGSPYNFNVSDTFLIKLWGSLKATGHGELGWASYYLEEILK